MSGTIIGSVLASILYYLIIKIDEPITSHLLLSSAEFGLFATIFAAPPAFIWGATLYALAVYKSKASYFYAFLIGATPGLILLLPQRSAIAELSLFFGISIGVCTHFLYKHFFASLNKLNFTKNQK